MYNIYRIFVYVPCKVAQTVYKYYTNIIQILHKGNTREIQLYNIIQYLHTVIQYYTIFTHSYTIYLHIPYIEQYIFCTSFVYICITLHEETEMIILEFLETLSIV